VLATKVGRPGTGLSAPVGGAMGIRIGGRVRVGRGWKKLKGLRPILGGPLSFLRVLLRGLCPLVAVGLFFFSLSDSILTLPPRRFMIPCIMSSMSGSSSFDLFSLFSKLFNCRPLLEFFCGTTDFSVEIERLCRCVWQHMAVETGSTPTDDLEESLRITDSYCRTLLTGVSYINLSMSVSFGVFVYKLLYFSLIKLLTHPVSFCSYVKLFLFLYVSCDNFLELFHASPCASINTSINIHVGFMLI